VRVTGLSNLEWRTDRPLYERLRFEAVAFTDFRHGPTTPQLALQDQLVLPPGYNPRTLAWAAALRREPRYANAEPRVLAQALLDHIRTANYTYTLAPGEYGRDAVDEFWLDRREGFCEHFAAAFVVVMRALGVPARVVTGFQGIDPLPVDGFWVVRQNAAHAWAEYWQPGEGWVRADPTAAVAPERIDRGRRLAPPQGMVAGAIANVSPELLARLRDGWEAINNRWNQWVLNYARGQQLDVLKKLGFASPSWQDLALLLIGALSTLALAGAAWAWWDRHHTDPWQRQMARLRRTLRGLGLPSGAHEPPRGLAQRVRARFGTDGEALAALLDGLERQRYGRDNRARPDAALTREFVLRARLLRLQGGAGVPR